MDTQQLRYPYRSELLIVQPTPFCNLACSYCYLRDKDDTDRLAVETLRLALVEILGSGLISVPTTLVWHAGEPLALPVAYFRTLLECVRQVDEKRLIRHSVQTNGTTLTQEWCDLLLEYDFDVGVSIDGPREIHDAKRVDRNGRGSFDRGMRGLNLLIENKIRNHIIAVVSRPTLQDPDATLDFFAKLGVYRIGFNLEEIEGVNARSEAMGDEDLVTRFFEKAHRLHVAKNSPVSIREFDQVYRLIAQAPAQRGNVEFVNFNEQVRPFGIVSLDHKGNLSTFSPELLGQPSAEYNGFSFGSVHTDGLAGFFSSGAFLSAFQAIQRGVARCAADCAYFSFCGGGSPSNKLYENGTFDSTETFYCRTKVKIPFAIALAALEGASPATSLAHETF